MELMEGGELFEKILDNVKISEEEARQITLRIIDAIGYCHNKGIIHRDLKPDNTLVENSNNKARLLDLGISEEAVDRPSDPSGTPLYMSPETLNEKEANYQDQIDLTTILQKDKSSKKKNSETNTSIENSVIDKIKNN